MIQSIKIDEKESWSFFGVTSIQYAVIDHGKMVFSGGEGYADVDMKKKPDQNTMYTLASISKMYTTVAVLQLVDQGKIDLDQPVTKYIPEFTMKDERYKQITVRMLLNHSSGLRGGNASNLLLYGDVYQGATKNFLENIKEEPLSHNPGEYSVYSNDGFTLAELVVEHVTGLTFTQYIHEKILSPLKLKNTYTAAESFAHGRLANVYVAGTYKLPYENFTTIGAGGIYSSAEDVCRFAQTFMKDNNGILSEKSIELMQQEEYKRGLYFEDPYASCTYGLGWDSVHIHSLEGYGIQAMFKGGDSGNSSSSVLVLPKEDIAVAVLSVGSSSGINEVIAEKIAIHYLHEQEKFDSTKMIHNYFAVDKNDSMPKEYEDYSGYYIKMDGYAEVKVKENGLEVFADGSSKPSKYEYYNDGWFYSEENQNWYKLFREEKNGKRYIYMKGESDYAGLADGTYGLYLYQKIEEKQNPQKVIDAWNQRKDKSYVLVNEHFSSQNIQFAMCAYEMKDIIGYNYKDMYFANARIVDENHLQCDAQIPEQYGRDLIDLYIYQKDGVEYLKENSMIFMDLDQIQNMSKEKKFTVTIPENGYIQYYKIPKEYKGKKIKVKVPNKASCIVYNKKYLTAGNTYMEKTNKLELPAGGYIAFAGDKNAKFTVEVIS